MFSRYVDIFHKKRFHLSPLKTPVDISKICFCLILKILLKAILRQNFICIALIFKSYYMFKIWSVKYWSVFYHNLKEFNDKCYWAHFLFFIKTRQFWGPSWAAYIEILQIISSNGSKITYKKIHLKRFALNCRWKNENISFSWWR